MNLINVLVKLKQIRQCIEKYEEVKNKKYIEEAYLCLDDLFAFFSNKLKIE